MCNYTQPNSVITQKAQYSDVIMIVIASQITGVSIVWKTVCSDADKRKRESSASLDFLWGEFTCFPIWWRHHEICEKGTFLAHIKQRLGPLKQFQFRFHTYGFENELKDALKAHYDFGFNDVSTERCFILYTIMPSVMCVFWRQFYVLSTLHRFVHDNNVIKTLFRKVMSYRRIGLRHMVSW